MFGEELWRQSHNAFVPGELTETGLLGLMLFGVALAGSAVASRARRSEALAARAGSDLANLAQLNERIVEGMETGALVVDENRRLRLVNAAARRLLLSETDVEGSLLALSFPALATALERWDRGAAIDAPLLASPQGGLELIPRFTRLGSSAGAPVLVQLEDAGRVREAAQQMKLAALGRLSAGVAHEIRNPLSAIHHAGQLLAESPQLDDQDRRMIDMIRRHSVRIDKIVEDVLDLSRREASEPGAISLREFLETSVAVYREGCPQRGSVIDYDGVDGAPVTVTLFGGRLQPGQNPYLDIVDDGRGIPRELQDRLFEPFVTGAHQGTGLGLYLARELCEYNQARLSQQPHAPGAFFRIVFAAV
jgi:two-component system sensor histidine kinase PilS (NtrC family)